MLVAIRAALPEILRRVIVSQASQALNARVDVGDVDLRLWRGGVTLEDVAVRAKGAPEPPPPTEENDPNAPPPPAFDEYSPIIGFKRFTVELHYLPLFQKTIQVREVELVQPRVALDRLASGDLNVLGLVPKQPVNVEAGATPEPSPTAAAAPGTPWAFGLDSFVLSDGRVRFRDLALEGSEPVELGIDRISVDEIALTPAVYGKPGTIALKLGVDEGTIDVTAHVTLDGEKVAVTTDVTANRLPLRRARLYVPTVGWSDLHGELDLGLTYELAPPQTNVLRGTLGLREVSVSVPGLEDVAVGWKSLAVTLDRIDLVAQRAAVQAVALDGATVVVHLGAEDLLPALRKKAAAAATTARATKEEAAHAAAVEQAAAEQVAAAVQTAGIGATTPIAGTPAEVAAGTETIAPAATPTDTAPATASPTPTDTAPAGGPTDTPGADVPTGTPAADATPSVSPATAAATPPAKPWGWEVGTIALTNTTVRVLSDQPPLDVGVTVTTDKLSGDDGAVGHANVALAVAPGSITLDGDVRIAPVPAFGGTLKIVDLPVPQLVAVAHALPPEALPSATFRSDLAIAAGLPAAAGGAAPADQLQVTGTIGLAALKLMPPQAPGVSVDLADLELRLDRLDVPGVIPPGHKAAAGAGIALGAALTLREPHVVRSGEQPLDVATQSIVLTVPSLTVPAGLAKLGPGDAVAIVSGAIGLELDALRVAMGEALGVEAAKIGLQVADLSLPVASAPPATPAPDAVAGAAPGAALAPPPVVAVAAPPVRFDLQLDLDAPRVTTAQGRELDAGAKAIALQVSDVVVPGFVAGAAPAATTEPLQAKATLTLTEPRAARADGKEFAVSAKSITVPLQSLAMPGVPGGLPPGAPAAPLRASLGEIRLEAPAIRVTRTKDGIVLPASGAPAPSGAAPSPSPSPAATPAASASPAAPGLDLQIAAVRILRGGLDFTDRAVQPAFSTRFAPIEVDARNIKVPGPQVKPLKVDITSVEQGQITIRGTIAPDAGSVELKVDQLALAPFNPYATTYSPYSIADGALTIDVKANAKGGSYDVKNDIRLSQFDLGGSEGDSLFEQNFGIPLSLALALLRDVQGNIDLQVPMQVDAAGNAQVDVMAVVRSALKQAIAGAVTSPLKMLGAAVGGKGAPIAPQPVAFRLGRAEATTAGAESAARLADFLAGRPAMGVALSAAATPDDARWLHEHALLGHWAEEGFFERSLGFITERGPRQRIRDYLEARVADQKPELSAEDAATLDQWLTEIPAPTDAELQALADARVAAVETVLRGKGIAADRVTRGPAPEDATKPLVGVRLQTAPH